MWDCFFYSVFFMSFYVMYIYYIKNRDLKERYLIDYGVVFGWGLGLEVIVV